MAGYVTENGVLGALQFIHATGLHERDPALFIDKDLDAGRVRSLVSSFSRQVFGTVTKPALLCSA